jgi:pantetheine-phosphate adenylyltransferase
MKKKLGVYAGSFNPFHVGHLDILRQAQGVFDKVIIAIGRNPDKDGVEREEFPTNNPALNGASVVKFGGLLPDYLNQLDVEIGEDYEMFLIRGLRNGEDLQYEQNQLQFIKEMYPSLKTVFFICDRKFEHISSKSLRALRVFSDKEYLKYAILPVAEPEPAKYGWDNSDL